MDRYPPLPAALRWIGENPARTAVLISIVLMIYQACLPEGLTLHPSARTIEWRVIPSESFKVHRSDIVGNVVPYWVFGHFVFAASWRKRRDLVRAAVLGFAGAVLMALAVEAVQLLNPIRGSAIWDLISGTVGGLLAVVTGAAYALFVGDRVAGWVRAETARRPLVVAAALVGAFMLADAAKPFFVISSADYLWNNIKSSNVIPFRPPGADIRDQIKLSIGSHRPRPLPEVERDLDYWAGQAEVVLLYGALLGLLAYGRRRSELPGAVLVSFATLAVAEACRLGIVGGRVDVTHLLLGLIAIPFVLAGAGLLRSSPRSALQLLVSLSLTYAIVTDLRPFELGPRSALAADMFIPLIHTFRDPNVMRFLWSIVEAVLVYVPVGATLYAVRIYESGGRRLSRWPAPGPTLILCAVLVSIVEIAQLWIRGRVTAIEDVLYAVIGGYVGLSIVRLLATYSGRTTER